MREILFKAKTISTGEWVEGYYFKARRHWHEYGIHEDWIVVNAIQNGGYCNVCGKCAIDVNTLCQYTGLTDKNGNKIWENDVLSIGKCIDVVSGEYMYPSIPYPANVKVKWDLCAWMWETITKDKYYIGFPDAWCHYEAEVIGNVFDNPEFVEVNMEVYYEDHRLKIIKKESGKYDIHDSKYGGKITHKDVSKEKADERIQHILSVRNRRQNRNRKE